MSLQLRGSSGVERETGGRAQEGITPRRKEIPKKIQSVSARAFLVQNGYKMRVVQSVSARAFLIQNGYKMRVIQLVSMVNILRHSNPSLTAAVVFYYPYRLLPLFFRKQAFLSTLRTVSLLPQRIYSHIDFTLRSTFSAGGS